MFSVLKNEISYIKNIWVWAVTRFEKLHPSAWLLHSKGFKTMLLVGYYLEWRKFPEMFIEKYSLHIIYVSWPQEEGGRSPFLGDMSSTDIVPVLIANLKLRSDWGIDLVFSCWKFSQASCLLVMYSYQPILIQRETHFLAYLDCQNSQFKLNDFSSIKL